MTDNVEQATKQRLRVAALCDRHSALAAQLAQGIMAARLADLATQTRADSFKVLVLGDFNVGKSMLINAMLGADVLPCAITPATAVITRLVLGEQPRVELYPHPTPTDVDPAPLKIAPDQLRAHIVMDVLNPNDRPRYREVVVYWPLALLQSGVELIDSPGLNAIDVHTETTLDYAGSADAIVMVFTAMNAGTLGERGVVEQELRMRGHQSMFFVVNAIDTLRADELDELRPHLTALLVPLTALGADGLHFTSARDALKERIGENRSIDIAATGVPAFERALKEFLVTKRAKIKVTHPAQHLLIANNRLRNESIPYQVRLQNTQLEVLEQRYAEAHIKLLLAKDKSNAALERIDAQIAVLRLGVEERGRPFFERAAAGIGPHLEDYDAKNPIRLRWKTPQTQATELVEELAEESSTWLTAQIRAFAETDLRTYLAERAVELNEIVVRSADEIGTLIDEIRDDLVGGDLQAETRAPKVSSFERIMTGLAGFAVGDPAAAIVGASFGLEAAVRSLLTQAAVAAVGIFVLALDPTGILLLLGGTGLVQAARRGGMLGAKITTKVGDEMAAKLRDSADRRTSELAASVERPLLKARDAFAVSLDEPIRDLEAQVERELEARRSGETDSDTRRRELDAMTSELIEAEIELELLIADWADR